MVKDRADLWFDLVPCSGPELERPYDCRKDAHGYIDGDLLALLIVDAGLAKIASHLPLREFATDRPREPFQLHELVKRVSPIVPIEIENPGIPTVVDDDVTQVKIVMLKVICTRVIGIILHPDEVEYFAIRLESVVLFQGDTLKVSG